MRAATASAPPLSTASCSGECPPVLTLAPALISKEIISTLERPAALRSRAPPQRSDTLTSAPAFIRAAATSTCSQNTAKCNGVSPFSSCASIFAPASMRRMTSLTFLARCNGVCWYLSFALTSTPALIRAEATAATFPFNAARCRSVSCPTARTLRTLTSAPARIRTATITALPAFTANCNGVFPFLFFPLTSAPALTRAVTSSRSPACIARCNGVVTFRAEIPISLFYPILI